MKESTTTNQLLPKNLQRFCVIPARKKKEIAIGVILKAKMEAGMEVNEKYRKTKKKEAMVR